LDSRRPPYEERDIRAVTSVFIELGQALGAYLSDFVVIGGAVPWLLLPDARPTHVGTLDVDLALNPDGLGEGRYASLVEILEDLGYERGVDGLKPFQLLRRVKLDGGEPIPVVVDLLMPKGAKVGGRKIKLLADFRVLEADGVEAALKTPVSCTMSGEMPDGRPNSVDLLVASIPALLVMKGYAITGRDKSKDAYDIYFSVRNFPGGPAALAEVCRPLLDEQKFRVGLQKLASKFRSFDDFGPQTVRRFCDESGALGDMNPDQIQQDAYGQVNAFLKKLDLA
jgi:hypothetical protein